MLFVSTAEDFANPIGELVSAEQLLGLRNLAFAVDPLGLYRIKPRALGGQQTWHYPHSTAAAAAGFDLAVVSSDPLSDLMAFVPACVVPDEKQSLLAPLFEPVAAPRKELGCYGAHRATVHEPQPGIFELRQIKPIAGECLGLGIVLSGLLLEEAHRRGLCGIHPRMQARSLKAGEPRLVLKAQSPLRVALSEPD